MAREIGKNKSIEASLENLDNILEQLEDGEVSLEESFKIYEHGMKLIKDITTSLDKVEKKMIVLDDAGQDKSTE